MIGPLNLHILTIRLRKVKQSAIPFTTILRLLAAPAVLENVRKFSCFDQERLTKQSESVFFTTDSATAWLFPLGVVVFGIW